MFVLQCNNKNDSSSRAESDTQRESSAAAAAAAATSTTAASGGEAGGGGGGGDGASSASAAASASGGGRCGIVRLSSIRELVEKGRHALLDITPSAVDKLNYAQFYPVVIFLRADSKNAVKELRTGLAKSVPFPRPPSPASKLSVDTVLTRFSFSKMITKERRIGAARSCTSSA